MNEQWRNIEGYPNYQVSNLGNVKSLNYNHTGREEILKPKMDMGYLRLGLYKDGKQKLQRINRLVAMVFIPIPEELKHLPLEQLEADHIDTDKTNNCVWNLYWTDRSGNMKNPLTRQHMSKAKTNGKTSKRVLQLDKDTGEVIRQWPSANEVQRQLDYSKGNISACCRGELKTAYGFKWKYA